MKVELNLAVAPSLRDRYALAWAAPAAVAAAAVLVLLSISAVRGYREYHRVHALVEDLRAQETKSRQREAELRRDLEKPELREIFRSVRFVNDLIEAKQSTVGELVSRVLPVMPPQVRLTGLVMGESGGNTMVRIAVTGKSEEAIEQFLSNLENSENFSDVAIISQGFAPEEGDPEPARLACSARYLRLGRQ